MGINRLREWMYKKRQESGINGECIGDSASASAIKQLVLRGGKNRKGKNTKTEVEMKTHLFHCRRIRTGAIHVTLAQLTARKCN